MNKIIESPLNPRKKISLNINVGILNLIKDLAKLTKTNNTLIIESLLVEGVLPLLKQFKTGWTIMAIETKDNSKKERINKLLQDLQEISKKDQVRLLTGELTLNYEESLKKKKVVYK